MIKYQFLLINKQIIPYINLLGILDLATLLANIKVMILDLSLVMLPKSDATLMLSINFMLLPLNLFTLMVPLLSIKQVTPVDDTNIVAHLLCCVGKFTNPNI